MSKNIITIGATVFNVCVCVCVCVCSGPSCQRKNQKQEQQQQQLFQLSWISII